MEHPEFRMSVDIPRKKVTIRNILSRIHNSLPRCRVYDPGVLSMLAILFSTMLLHTSPPPPFFQGDGDQKSTKGHALVDVSTDVGWIGPGQEFHIIVAITPDAGWHTYWENPGDSGAPTEIEVGAPEGYRVGKPIFPRPEIFITANETTYGYSKQVAIFIPVKAPSSTLDGRADFQVTTAWLACKKSCVQGEETSTITISVRAWEEGPIRKSKSIQRWQESLPHPLSELENGSVRIVGNFLKITGTTKYRHVGFLGIEKSGVRFTNTNTLEIIGDSFTISVPVNLDPSNATDDTFEIAGLLTLGRNLVDPSYTVTLIVEQNTTRYFSKGVEK